MKQLLDDLVKVMTLERLELDLFRGESRDIGSPQVFGGQVLGQALTAATATVENRMVHSLHAYFLRRGDPARRTNLPPVGIVPDGRAGTDSPGAHARGSSSRGTSGTRHLLPRPPAAPPARHAPRAGTQASVRISPHEPAELPAAGGRRSAAKPLVPRRRPAAGR